MTRYAPRPEVLVARIGLRQKLRYRFDNLMARGTGAQIAMLALVSGGLILVGCVAIALLGVTPTDDSGAPESFAHLLWDGLMRTLDAGTMGGDHGPWALLVLFLFITLGGVFVISSLIGILNNGVQDALERLRKGRSLVVERGHTVILGYTQKVHTLIRELAAAHAHHDACVVVLANRDKVEMDDEIRHRLGHRRLRVVTRSGDPLSIHDLGLVNLTESSSVIILAPDAHEDGSPMEPHESDTAVLKTILAITKNPEHRDERFHIVAELQSQKTLEVARTVAGEHAVLLLAPPLVSRLLVQTGRQSGLSTVYTELLDFEGSEIYMRAQPELAGKTFHEALLSYEDSTVLGLIDPSGEILLPPPFERRLASGDQVIVLNEADEAVKPTGRGAGAVDASAISGVAVDHSPHPERVLVLGTSERLSLVVHELDSYLEPGSQVAVVGENDERGQRLVGERWENLAVTFKADDVTDRTVLEGLDVPAFDHVLLLSETEGRTHELADARTMITLLHVRDISHRAGKVVPVTSEILEVQNRDLAAVHEADDFIVSNTFISLMMAQVSENPRLVKVFDDLFHPEGYELFLRPAPAYVKEGVAADFYTVVEAAARRGEVAIGYRLAAHARNAGAAYGVVVNPHKSKRVELGARDKVIVLAERPVRATRESSAGAAG
jgi:voltage-gated potassium channel Kch